jgi:hypothetical protein
MQRINTMHSISYTKNATFRCLVTKRCQAVIFHLHYHHVSCRLLGSSKNVTQMCLRQSSSSKFAPVTISVVSKVAHTSMYDNVYISVYAIDAARLLCSIFSLPFILLVFYIALVKHRSEKAAHKTFTLHLFFIHLVTVVMWLLVTLAMFITYRMKQDDITAGEIP